MLDTGENPDAPQPREMIDLEVSWIILYICENAVISDYMPSIFLFT